MIESEVQAKQHILVIDDSKVVRWQAKKLLEEDYEVHLAEDGQQAWDLLQEDELVTLAFCDLQMPEMDGYQFLEKVRSCDDVRLINLPVVIITGDSDNKEVKQRCLDSGATDFIPKPFDDVIIKGRAAAYTGLHSRLSKLESEAEHDHLTGLASVQYFHKFGDQGLAMALRHHTEMTIVLAELDNQEALLEKLGKKAFAKVLVRIGKQISSELREEDLVARLALARYGVVLPLTNRVGAHRVVERIHQGIKNLHLRFSGEPLKLTFSVGVTSPALDHKVRFRELVRDAKGAMRKAQANGGDAVIVFDQAPVTAPSDRAAPKIGDSTSPSPESAMIAAARASDVEHKERTAETAVQTPAITEQPKVETPVDKPIGDGQQLLSELDNLLVKAQSEDVGHSLLRSLMLRIMPLLELADHKLELGMGAALSKAKQRLSNS